MKESLNKKTAEKRPLFEKAPLDSVGIRCYELLSTKGGAIRIISSAGLWRLKGHDMDMYTLQSLGEVRIDKLNRAQQNLNTMAEGPDSIFFVATHDNEIYYASNSDQLQVSWPPFNFPPRGQPFDKISTLYIDHNGDLFIGTQSDNFYWIKVGGNKKIWDNVETKIIDSVFVFVKGARQAKKIILAPGTGVFSFAQDNSDKNIIWIGTSHGLFRYNKIINESKMIRPLNIPARLSFTVTHIELNTEGNLWFSTLEKGMGFYDQQKNNIQFYPYPKKKTNAATRYPVKTFCYKSGNDFFVAVMDSLPAVFNTLTGTYTFINDASLKQTADSTTDIKVDKLGNLFLIKGGAFYYCKASVINLLAPAIKQDSNLVATIDSNGVLLASTEKLDSNLLAPFIKNVYTINKEPLASIDYYPERLHELKLNYNQNSILIVFGANDLGSAGNTLFAYKIDGITNGWILSPSMNLDTSLATIMDLKPGKYLFELKVKVGNEDWRKQQAKMVIIVSPAYWQTWWFWTSVILGMGLIIGLIMWWRIKAVKRREKEKFAHEKQLMELEAMALRAQMNPHFIFNCLNSIKSLIQQNENEKSVTYLTTFSKLIRTLLNNADKKEISLYDEIETCKLYLQLEAMRFDTKFSFAVNVDENIDLKSIQVPALIIQPFIENAIWHGIVPRNNGGKVSLNVMRKSGVIEIVIDDNGIGREASKQNKSASGLTHQSKGVNLTQSRLELNNLLQQRQAELEIIDKKDEQGIATGTTVVIKIKEELS